MTVKQRSKFNVSTNCKKRTYDGVTYDSELEMKFYRNWVIPRLNSGEIVNCERQVKYELQPKFEYKGTNIRSIDYVADYVVTYSDGRISVIDTKGFADATAKLKKKMFMYCYPDIEYVWISYSKMDGGWIDYNKLQKLRSERKKLKQGDKK